MTSVPNQPTFSVATTRMPFSLSCFWMRQFYFLLPMALMLCTMMAIGILSDASNPFVHTYDWQGGWAYDSLDQFDDHANALYYGVYLLIVWVMVTSKSIPHRVFLRNFLVVQLLFTLLMVKGLKYAVGEPRPYAGDVDSQPFSADRQFHSFPSGHTAEAVAGASPLAYYIKQNVLTVLWGILPASIAFCRIYFFQHDVVDVLGSVVIGLMASYLLVSRTERYLEMHSPSTAFSPWSFTGFWRKKNG